jgi:cell division protease FtsH
VLYGGIEAERLLIGDISTGASAFGDPRSDLFRATQLATLVVEACGMSTLAAPLRVFRDHEGKRDVLSGHMAEQIDRQVNTVVAEAQARAAKILTDHKGELLSLRDELLEKKTIEPERVNAIIAEVRKKYAVEVADALENPPAPTARADDTTPLDKPAAAPRRSQSANTGEK